MRACLPLAVGSHILIEGNQHGNFVFYGYGALRQRLAPLTRTLGMERRLTLEECYQLIDLSEAIFEHGRMMQACHRPARHT